MHCPTRLFAAGLIVLMISSLSTSSNTIDLRKKTNQSVTSTTPTKTKVAILGGGMGALTTAFYLANSSVADTFDMSIYQMGWRLGGKAAAGRNLQDGYGSRIEEHGIHMLFSFYHNTFQMLRTVYNDLQRPASHPLATLDKALVNHPEITFTELRNGTWNIWPFLFPAYGPDPWKLPPQPIHLLRQSPACLTLQVAERWLAILLDFHLPDELLIDAIRAVLLRIGSKTGTCLGQPDHLLRSLLMDIAVLGQKFIEVFEKISGENGACDIDNDVFRHLCWIIEFALANLRGLLRDQPKTWEDLDKWDFLQWILSNGFPKELSNIPPVLSIYISGFAWEGGDLSKPNYAAGAALQTSLLTAGDYFGQWSYYMRGGTGDTLVLPIYQWLAKRGVKFHFFHKVSEMTPSADGKSLDEITLTVQAQLVDQSPNAAYQPLIMLQNGMEAWPEEPQWDQLQNGDQLRQYNFESYWSSGYPKQQLTLKRGVDFDFAVSAMSVKPLQYVAQPLMKVSPAFRAMVENSAATPTFSIQMWFDKTAEEMGAHGYYGDSYNIVAFAPPFYGCVDYRHVIPFEEWQLQQAPNVSKDVLYWSLNWQPLPGPHPFNDSSYPELELQRLREVGKQYMNANLRHVYPGATLPNGQMNQQRLVPGQSFENQFFKVNIDPNEQYVLTPAGQTQFRLAPGNSTFTNLFLAGDYTFNGINIGCIESTVRSGVMAALAVIENSQAPSAQGWYVIPVDPIVAKVKNCESLFEFDYCSLEEAIAAQLSCRSALPHCDENPDFCFIPTPTTSYCYPHQIGCSNPLPGNCSFYSNCLESRYKCGLQGYPLGYANYYCRKFDDLCGQLSPQGQRWCVSTRDCLISNAASILTQPTSLNYTCAQVKDIGFGLHAKCYTQPQKSFCTLPLSDIMLVIETLKAKDLFSAETMKQMLEVAEICAGIKGKVIANLLS